MTKKSKTVVPVDRKQNVTEAFQSILQHNFDYLIAWEDASRSWQDIEGVHQVRVSFRRIRSAFSAFRRAIPREATSFWSEETRWMAGELGMARDLDVFIDEGLGAVRSILPLPGEHRMLALAEHHRELAYQSVNAMLDGERYKRFKAEFPEWVKNRAWEEVTTRQKQWNRMFSDVVPFARKLLDRLERRVLAAGSHVDKDDSEQMHQLRIECKKLRYGSEFFMPVIKGLEEFIGHMKGLQDLLGVMNDVVVMKHILERVLEGETDPEVLQYAGGLVGWRTRQFRELLASFDERWDELAHAKHPWWSKHSEHS